jgi:hypothetical protein
VDADRTLKRLFRLRAAELLGLTGDHGARVVSRLVPEVAAVTRRLDFVMKLERGRELYLRHLEFEMRFRPILKRRMFEYAAALATEHGLPVVSTAVILRSPAPPTIDYEERVRGRMVCWRHIPVLRLWKVKPTTAIRMGPGGAALVGLMGRPDVRVLEAAARRIKAKAPKGQSRDLCAVLRMLSEGRYTARELERIVPEEVVMGSSLFAKVRKQSRAEGRAEGRVEGRVEGATATARSVCLGLVRQHHAASLPVLAPVIESCSDADRLQEWALAAPRLSDSELVALVRSHASEGGRPRAAGGHAQGRAPRPARRSKRR